jgi:hypothetical protein
MVNRGGVGAIVARGRAPIILALLVLGGIVLFKHDISRTALSAKALQASRISSTMAGLPLIFEPNQGQTDAQVKFMARGSGYGLYLTGTEAVLVLADSTKPSSGPAAVKMQFAGANQNAAIAAVQALPGHTNYLLGNNPARWHRNLPQFARVQYRNLYPGVDLDFYGKQGRLEYDFEVGPGADPRAINLQFRGAELIQIAANGDLVLPVDGREVRFQAPHVYQKTASREQAVAGKFVQRAGNQVGFEVGDYDRSRTLVIDPVLTFSTLFGGSGAESCAAISGASFVAHCPAIAVDSANRVYIAGATSATSGFPGSATPTTLGPGGGGGDVFVARVSNSGSALAVDYLTFVGGSGIDYPVGIAVDSGFDVYLAGNTVSSDFPTTSTGFQTSAATAGNHAFVTELNSSASAALYSTYLAGNGVDTASDMALDNQGRIYLIGTTTSTAGSTHFPTTQGALQGTGLATDQFFFSKLNTTLSGPNSLLYSTFIGGSTPSSGVVMGGGIAVDANLNVYLAGGTTFTDMPVVNAFQGTNLGGSDVWAGKLTPANNTQQYTPLYETYFGGTADEVAYGVSADPGNANLYVTGSTTTPGISSPASVTPLQANYGGGISDAFVAKFGVPPTTGTTQGSVPLTYFTYLGGGSQDVGLAIVADSNQNARVAGFTASGPLANSNPLFNSPGGGIDAFFARIVTNTTTTTTTSNTSSTSILGGSGTDRGTSTAVDASLNSYVAGETASGNFPVATDPSIPAVTPLQASLSGASDAFVSKIGPNTTGLTFVCTGSNCPSSNPVVNPTPVGVGSTVTFTYSIYNVGDPVTGVVFTDNIALPANSAITTATASSGTCSISNGTSALCNLGTVNTSNTTTSGTTTTTSTAATVTITVSATAPASTGTTPTKPPSIGNSGTLTVAGTNFQKTVSGTASVNDFGIQVTSLSTQTVSPGAQATYTLTVTPTGIFPESVSLSCGTGLPSQAQCAFSNANPIPNLSNGPQSRTLDITTTARVTTPASLRPSGLFYAFWFPVSGLALIAGGLSPKRRWLMAIAITAVMSGIALQAGCSNTSNTSTTTGTPAGTYTIPINATSGSATRTTAVTLIVK